MVNNRRGHRRGKQPIPTDTPADNPTDNPTNPPTDAPANAPTDNSTDNPTANFKDALTNALTKAFTDLPKETADSSNIGVSNSNSALESVESSNTVPSTEPTKAPVDPRFTVTVEFDHPVQPNKRGPTVTMGEFDDGANATDGVHPTNVVQAAARPKKKKFEPFGNLPEANQKVSDLEDEVYKLEQSGIQSKKYQKRARADDLAKIKELDDYISKADDALVEAQGRNITLERQMDAQKSEIQTRVKKCKELDGQLAHTALELRNADNHARMTNERAVAYQGENGKLRETIAMLSANRQSQEEANAANIDAANNFMSEHLAAEDDVAKRNKMMEKLQEENAFLRSAYRGTLERIRSHDFASQQSSTAGSRPSSSEAAQPLKDELHGLRGDGEVAPFTDDHSAQRYTNVIAASFDAKETNVSIKAPETESTQSMPSFALTLSTDPRFKKFDYRGRAQASTQTEQSLPQMTCVQCQAIQPLPMFDESTQTDLPSSLDQQTQTDSPLSPVKDVECQTIQPLPMVDEPMQTDLPASTGQSTQTDSSPVKDVECQAGDSRAVADQSSQTDADANDSVHRPKYAESGTQVDVPADQIVYSSNNAESSTKTDDPVDQKIVILKYTGGKTQPGTPADKSVYRSNYAEASTQTVKEADQQVERPRYVECETQTDAPTNDKMHDHENESSTISDTTIDDSVHYPECEDKSTQTNEPITDEVNHLNHGQELTLVGHTTLFDQIPAPAPVNKPAAQRLGYQDWFLILAACMLLLIAAFTLYHGLQARAERAMWLAANDYTRRAVIYHRQASAKGQWVGWLTTAKMRDLGVGYGYGSGFGKYGVEM